MSITFLNKWLLAGERHGERFGFPFLLNTMNNLVVCLIAWVLTRVPSLRPPTLAPRLLATVVGPIGLLTALDIGFSNLALMRLPVSLHTILRGTTPAFVLLFAIAFGLQVMTPEDPLISPEDPLITPDDPLITPDDPLMTKDAPLITPEDLPITPDDPLMSPSSSSPSDRSPSDCMLIEC